MPNVFELWHNRLGHASKHVVSNILQHCNISFANKMTIDVCQACCLGKAHCLPSVPSPNSYHFPPELIYIDLWEPSPVLLSQGYLFYIALIDAFSKFKWVYFLKSKSEAFPSLPTI